MPTLDEDLRATLVRLDSEGLRRDLRLIESATGPSVRYGGGELLMLSSNDYLGLANHPAVRCAAAEAIERYGVGAGASRLIAGNLLPHHALELEIARLKGTEAALVFGSGYLANLGAITALASAEDIIFSDELNHASLIDGCRLSRAQVRVYRHCDSDDLAAMLAQARGFRRRLIVTDSVFSMDGDFAPLREVVALARRFDAAVMIDEAHAVGVVGADGLGLAAELGVARAIEVQVGTLSKALGSYGAYVAGSQTLIDLLVNRARSFIYSTGLAPALAAAAGRALQIMIAEPQRRERLWRNAAYLRAQLCAAGFRIGSTASPIIPVIVGESESAVAFARRLFERGVYVIAIRPPTVPPQTARLRLTPTSEHREADLDRVATAMVESGRELGLI
jgi:8-amino-7-oxononanoate synthase